MTNIRLSQTHMEVSLLLCSSHSTENIHPGINQFQLWLKSDFSTERTANLLLQTHLNVPLCTVSSCLPRKKALGVCLCAHGNDQCHQACLINAPVMSTPVFHFAIPSGSILKSLSPHFSAHLSSLLLSQSKTSSTSFLFPTKTILQSVPLSLPHFQISLLPNYQTFLLQGQIHGIHLSASSCLSVLILPADIPFLWFGLFTLDRSCFCKTTLKDGERVAQRLTSQRP